MDQVLSDWAMAHFGGILHQATKFDKSKAQIQVKLAQQMIENIPPSSWFTKIPLEQAPQQASQQLIIGTQSSLIIQNENAMGPQVQVLRQAVVAHVQQGIQQQLPQGNPAQGNLSTNMLQAQVHGQAGVAQVQQGVQQQHIQGNSVQGSLISSILQVQAQEQAGVNYAQQGIQQHIMQGNSMQGNLTSNTMQMQVQGQAGVTYVQQGFQQQLPSVQAQANKQL